MTEKYFAQKWLPSCFKKTNIKSKNSLYQGVPVTPFGFNRWLLLMSYILVNALTAYLYFGWAKGLQDMLFRSGAFSWLCPDDAVAAQDYLPRCNIQQTRVGNLVSVSLVSSIISSVIAGTSLDFFGPKITATTGLIINLSGWILLAESNKNLVGYVPAMALIGMGCNFSCMSIITVARLFPERRRSIIAIATSAASCSMFVMVICNTIWKTHLEVFTFRGILWGYIIVASCVALPIVLLLLPWEPFKSLEEKQYDDENQKETEIDGMNKEDISFSSVSKSGEEIEHKVKVESLETIESTEENKISAFNEVSNDSSHYKEKLLKQKNGQMPKGNLVNTYSYSTPAQVISGNFSYNGDLLKNSCPTLSASVKDFTEEIAVHPLPQTVGSTVSSLCCNKNALNTASCYNNSTNEQALSSLSASNFSSAVSKMNCENKIMVDEKSYSSVASLIVKHEYNNKNSSAPLCCFNFSDEVVKINKNNYNEKGKESEVSRIAEAVAENNEKGNSRFQYNTEKFDTAASLPASVKLYKSSNVSESKNKNVNNRASKSFLVKFCSKFICKSNAKNVNFADIEMNKKISMNNNINEENNKSKIRFSRRIKEGLLHPTFISTLKEKIYFLAIVNFSIALLRSDFLYKTSYGQLGEDVYNVLGYFMPCMCSCTLVLGCIAQKVGPLFGLWIVATVGTLAYTFAIVANSWTKWLALFFLWMHMCFVQTSMYIYLFELFPQIHFGKLMGVAYLLGGLGSLLGIPIYEAAVLHFERYFEMDLLMLGCCVVSFCIISYITYVYVHRKREAKKFAAFALSKNSHEA